MVFSDTPDEERLKRSKICVFICNKDFNKVHVSVCCSPPFVYIYIYNLLILDCSSNNALSL